MAETIQQILQSLKTAEGLYHRLVLLVGESGTGKSGVLRSVAEDLSTEVINVNLMVSAELLELTGKQRALRLPGILHKIADTMPSTVVLDNLEILFDKHLDQDPLLLLEGISRNRSVVSSWNGRISGGKLIYAEMGHPEYRSYESVDAIIVSMDGVTTVDSADIERQN
jgi:ABC-type branched-subunit amino acid transport system ATPase component